MKPIRELPCVCPDGALQSCQNTETQHIPLQASTNTLTIENEALNKDGEIGFSYGVYVSTPSHPHFLSSSSKKVKSCCQITPCLTLTLTDHSLWFGVLFDTQQE